MGMSIGLALVRLFGQSDHALSAMDRAIAAGFTRMRTLRAHASLHTIRIRQSRISFPRRCLPRRFRQCGLGA